MHTPFRQRVPSLVRTLALPAAGATLGGLLLLLGASEAQPPAPAAFCDAYPDAPACASGDVSCDACHTAAPALNVYGEDIAANLLPSEDRPLHVDVFSQGLPEALVAVEDLDSDLDAYSNLEEIAFGSDPADPESVPVEVKCKDADKKDAYDLCGYDPDFAFKRVMLDFCGRSPTLEEREAFGGKLKHVHEQLDVCLDSEHWRGMFGVVWNLANSRIGPTQALKAGRDQGPIPLGDYDDDYAYWVWMNTDDRDARALLTGERFATAEVTGSGTVYEDWNRSPLNDLGERGELRAQLVLGPRRAGMLTHRWFLMANTMFTSIPRTTAAMAYRHYLGYDIARLEGLYPVAEEPVDYDDKGVQREECAVCHSTLDPLSYPFSRYEGIGGGSDPTAIPFTYNDDRLEGFTYIDGDFVADTPEQGMLLGEPVADLVEWAEVAANSDAFRRKLVSDYWKLLLGDEPGITEQQTFAELVERFSDEHGYQVEAMLHDLVETEAYGAP